MKKHDARYMKLIVQVTVSVSSQGTNKLISMSDSRQWWMSGVVCGTHGRDENCIQNFCRKPEGKRQLGRRRRKWEIILDWILGQQGGRC
jgi:hypothetical protein